MKSDMNQGVVKGLRYAKYYGATYIKLSASSLRKEMREQRSKPLQNKEKGRLEMVH